MADDYIQAKARNQLEAIRIHDENPTLGCQKLADLLNAEGEKPLSLTEGKRWTATDANQLKRRLREARSMLPGGSPS